MGKNSGRLRDDAVAIWRAGLDAVDSHRLVRECIGWADDSLIIAQRLYSLGPRGRIAVVGAGKAGAGMASGVESALAGSPGEARLFGWVNVPSDCVRRLSHIHLHGARPAGVNEPTAEGVAGSAEILRLVRTLSQDDVCLVLLSGGGSALLPAPIAGISLADKQTVTRFLMTSGATIDQLNCVRKHLSQIKGGKLAAAAGAARVIALVLSDVVGDPLDVIASGPTVSDLSTAGDALAVLRRFDADKQRIPAAVWSILEGQSQTGNEPPGTTRAVNVIVGNNATALRAAEATAGQLGYAVQSLGSDRQGVARDVGRELAERARLLRDTQPPGRRPTCLLSGGEPVVRLTPTDRPRKGGRNQELALSAVDALWNDGMRGIVLLSGGTDGEDGPTDAAGAVADEALVSRAKEQGLSPGDFLAINNSYAFFDAAEGLLKTGPTHTNVMDVRVVLIAAR